MRAQTAEPRWARFLLTPLGLAALYVLTGWPGLLLAVPPGYATPIFVPAGLALSAVLIVGVVCLPGIFLGSLLLNLWVGYSIASTLDVSELANSVVIAAASTLQAGLGAVVLRRAIGQPALLDQAPDLLRFLLLTPLLCLVSATLSLGGMAALGTIERSGLLLSWVHWWIGDTLGVLVMLPLMLAFFAEPRNLWRGRAPYVAVPILAFFALFVVIFVRISTWEFDRSLMEFRMRSQHLADSVQASMEQQGIFLEQLGVAFQIRPSALTAHDFERLVGRLPPRLPMSQAVGWAPRVAAADRADFELAMQETWPGFSIRERDVTGVIRPAATRAYFYPLTFLHPFAGKEEAIGLDIGSHPQKQAAIDASITSGNATATDPIRVLEQNGRTGSILLIYAVQGGPNGPGVIFAALRMQTFFEKLLAPFDEIMTARLIDVGDPSPLFDNFEAVESSAFFETEFSFGTRRYLLRTQPTRLYLATNRGWESWVVLSVGVLATGLLGALLLLGSGYAHRIQQLVDERTFELQVANQRLSTEIEERERAESALHQARHMEAIGQLTGGVAHDFNNLLQIVLGNLELLHRHVRDLPARRLMATAERAAERGARLVESLLAFARRQALQPEIVDINRLIRDFGELINQAVGPAVEVRLDLTARPCFCRIDPAQFQSAILNLAVNARDAMPEGGLLTIESHPLYPEPGETSPSERSPTPLRIVIVLRDSGCGMTPDVLKRAFEPFFSTKDVGRGSGLGLSQVYGFLQQSGGQVTLASEVGVGTEVKICLPLVSIESSPPVDEPVSGREPAPGSAAILVVEDDPDVRELIVENLATLGYTVLCAADARAALSILEGDQPVDLLFSDIGLGGDMPGDELGRRACALRTDLKVLLTTGYAADQHDMAESATNVLRKPFRGDELAEAVRATLQR